MSCSHVSVLFDTDLLRTHESPVSYSEELGQRVEGDVASWTLGVVVWRAELGAGGREATAGDGLGGTDCGAGEHLLGGV